MDSLGLPCARDGLYAVDDSWVEPDDRETDTDRFDPPVPAAELDRMAWWGAEPVRAAVLVGGRARLKAERRAAPGSAQGTCRAVENFANVRISGYCISHWRV